MHIATRQRKGIHFVATEDDKAVRDILSVAIGSEFRADGVHPARQKRIGNDDVLVIDLLADALAQRDQAALELLYGAGLRAAELCALTVDSLDLANLKAIVTGKGDRQRMVVFGVPAAP